VAAFAVAAVMLVFEAAKQFLTHRLSLWESHLITILFTTVLATVAASLVGRKFARLSRGMAEKEQAAERARLSNQIQLVLESTGQGLYGIDLQGKCTFINRAVCEMIDYRPEEAMGRNMHDLVHHHRSDGSPYPVDQCPIYRAFQKGEGCRVDTEVIWRRDGTPIPVEYSSFPVLEGGRITGAVVTVIDITERKRSDEKLRGSDSSFVRFSRMPSSGSLSSRLIARNISRTVRSTRCWATPEKN
jgi:PAS domain S-box-containing protein